MCCCRRLQWQAQQIRGRRCCHWWRVPSLHRGCPLQEVVQQRLDQSTLWLAPCDATSPLPTCPRLGGCPRGEHTTHRHPNRPEVLSTHQAPLSLRHKHGHENKRPHSRSRDQQVRRRHAQHKHKGCRKGWMQQYCRD
eukprot:scaffold109473_cov33-Tisochrysis_lutea.AAC.4